MHFLNPDDYEKFIHLIDYLVLLRMIYSNISFHFLKFPQ